MSSACRNLQAPRQSHRRGRGSGPQPAGGQFLMSLDMSGSPDGIVTGPDGARSDLVPRSPAPGRPARRRPRATRHGLGDAVLRERLDRELRRSGCLHFRLDLIRDRFQNLGVNELPAQHPGDGDLLQSIAHIVPVANANEPRGRCLAVVENARGQIDPTAGTTK